MGTCHSTASIASGIGSLENEIKIIFVLGGPGSGKGTQCEKIVSSYDCAHISAGDLLRVEVNSGTKLGKKCNALMKEGKLVPQEITLSLLQKAIISSEKKVFLIDGFPRSVEQAARFESDLKPCDMVLFFECSEKVMTERLLNRGKTSGRSDDNLESIKKRLKTFEEISSPVAKLFESQNKCFRISSEESPDTVFKEVSVVLDKYLRPVLGEQDRSASDSSEGETLENRQQAVCPPGDKEVKNAEDQSLTKEDTHPDAQVLTPRRAEGPRQSLSGDMLPSDGDNESNTDDVLVEQTEEMNGGEAKRRIVLVLGGPGSGKGTQCDLIVRDYGYCHISLGDLLRKEVQSGTDLGKECDDLMQKGLLVPNEIAINLLKSAIGERRNYLIDGFPRSVEQAALFESEFGSCDCVLYFDCSEEVMLKRMMDRAKTSGRTDDNPETMKARLTTFSEISSPVVKFYTDQQKCHSISAEVNPEEIYVNVKAVLDSFKETETDILILDGALPDEIVILLREKGLSCYSAELDESVIFDSYNMIIWNADSPGVTKLKGVKQAAEGIKCWLPPLEVLDLTAPEATGQQMVRIHMIFDNPIGAVAESMNNDSEERSLRRLEADDPELIPFISKLMDEDMKKVEEMVGKDLSISWKAVYEVTEKDDERLLTLRSVEHLDLDREQMMRYAEQIVDKIVDTAARLRQA